MLTGSMDIGGAETHILELAKGLVSRGYFVAVASAGGALEKELIRWGVFHIYAPLNSRLPHRILQARRIIRASLRQYHFDIIHAHTRLSAFVLRLLGKRYPIRKAVTAHLDFKVTPLTKRLAYWGEKTLAVSEDLRGYLVEAYGVSYDNISLTVNGIDTALFAPKKEGSVPHGVEEDAGIGGANRRENDVLVDSKHHKMDDASCVMENHAEKDGIDCLPVACGEKSMVCDENAPIIVHVSRMDRDRAYTAFLLCDIISELFAAFGAKLLLVGGGELYDKLKRKADAVNTLHGNIVTLTGNQTNVLPYLQKGAIFVGVSRAALEAMAVGLPTVLAGNTGYMGIYGAELESKAVENNFTCRGMPSVTKAVLLRDLTTLLTLRRNDRESFRKLGELCRRTVTEGYSVQRMVDQAEALYEELRPFRRKTYEKTAVLGYHGFGNLGDELLLSSLVKALRKNAPDRGITVLSHKPEKTASDYGVSAVYRGNPFQCFWAIVRAKELYVGGGSLLQTETSSRSLWYYAAWIGLAKLFGVKVVYYAAGLGGFPKGGKRLADRLQKNAIVALRDERSLYWVSKAAYQSAVFADPGLAVESASESHIRRLLADAEGKPYFVIATNGCIGNKQYLEELEKASVLAMKRGYFPFILTAQPSVDKKIAKQLAKKLSKLTGVTPTVYAPSAKEAMGLIQGCAFLITSRLHPLIMAAKGAKASILYSDSPKCRGFAEGVFDHDVAVSLDGSVVEKLLLLFDGPDAFRPNSLKVTEQMERLGDMMPFIKSALSSLATEKEKAKALRFTKNRKSKKDPLKTQKS